MLRSLLVGLDGSSHARSATDFALGWAARFDALAVGLSVVDLPTSTAPEAVPMMGAAYHTGEIDPERLGEARRLADQWLEQFSLLATERRVSSKVLEEEGDPIDAILTQSQRYDLIVLGQRTHFRYATQLGPCDTLHRVLHSTSRPIVAVPEKLPAGEAIVVAFDGSAEASRALFAYQALGLGGKFPTYVVTVADEHDTAARIAGRAVDYLASHGIHAQAKPIVGGHKSERILEQVSEVNGQLLVMGAFGHSPSYEFLFGSTTQRVLRGSWVPLFMVP